MSQKPQIQNIYGLSPMQEGMLFHSLMDSDSNAYFEQMSFVIQGNINLEKFEEAFNHIIQRYDVLRTIFKHEKVEKPLQIVIKERTAKIRYEDLRKLNPADQETQVQQIRDEDRKKGFDLARNILMRLIVLHTKDDEYRIIWSHHHILMDGWCLGIIIKEFMTVYDALVKGNTPQLPEVVPYSTYISWLDKQDRDKTRQYWNNYLQGYEKQCSVPQQAGSKTVDHYTSGKNHFHLSKELTSSIQELATQHKVTSNIILQAVWGLLLQRYNYADDAVFGAVVSGRPPEINGVEEIVGLFINTIPVRVRAEEKATFSDLIAKMQQSSVNSTQHDYYPLAEIQHLSDLKSDLINNIIVFENYPLGEEIENSDSDADALTIKSVEMFEQTNYGLILVVIPGDEMLIKLEYNALLYASDTIDRVQKHFTNILREVTNQPDIALSAIQMLDEEEKKQLLEIYEGV